MLGCDQKYLKYHTNIDIKTHNPKYFLFRVHCICLINLCVVYVWKHFFYAPCYELYESLKRAFTAQEMPLIHIFSKVCWVGPTFSRKPPKTTFYDWDSTKRGLSEQELTLFHIAFYISLLLVFLFTNLPPYCPSPIGTLMREEGRTKGSQR